MSLQIILHHHTGVVLEYIFPRTSLDIATRYLYLGSGTSTAMWSVARLQENVIAVCFPGYAHGGKVLILRGKQGGVPLTKERNPTMQCPSAEYMCTGSRRLLAPEWATRLGVLNCCCNLPLPQRLITCFISGSDNSVDYKSCFIDTLTERTILHNLPQILCVPITGRLINFVGRLFFRARPFSD